LCLNNEIWSLFRIVTNIYNSADTITSAFENDEAATTVDRFVKWNCDNHMGTILNVDGSCNGIPIRFLRYGIPSDDVLLAELMPIYHGLRMAIDMGIDDLTCYSDSLLSINLIKGDTPHYHIYASLFKA